LALLAAAGLLAPLNQARIHTTTSLSKHVDFGAWFAAAAAGYAIAKLSTVSRYKLVHAATAVLSTAAVVIPIGFIGWQQAGNFFQAWPDSAEVAKILRTVTASHPGNYLAEDYDVAAYYLENSITWHQWSNTWYFSYIRPPMDKPIVGSVAYRTAISDGYFKLIILDFGDTAYMDKIIAEAMRRSGDYHVIAEAPYWDKFGTGRFTIWAYSEPRHRHTGASLSRDVDKRA
jgi:hypothetical protein